MIDKEKIKYLAKLAYVDLEENEIDSLTSDLNKILSYVSKIDELKFLSELEPMTNIVGQIDLRDDETKINDFSYEQIIKNFPEREDNYLKVPKILDKGDI